jgi:DNA gyrase subunit A
MLFFTNRGRVFRLRTHEIPDVKRQAKGIPIINLIDIESNERVTAILAAPDFENSDFLIFATRAGEVKKSPLNDFSQVRRNGLRAMRLEEGDELLNVKHCRAGDNIILVTERGQSARFNVDLLRTASRISGGVRGIRLVSGDQLASMDVVIPDAQLLVVTQNGYGKRTPLSSYPVKGRGIGGVRAIRTTDRTGPVAAARVVQGYEELMMISAGGIVIRTPLDTVSERTGRATSGVILMNLRDGDRLAALRFSALAEWRRHRRRRRRGSADEEPGRGLAMEPDADALAALPTDARDADGRRRRSRGRGRGRAAEDDETEVSMRRAGGREYDSK